MIDKLLNRCIRYCFEWILWIRVWSLWFWWVLRHLYDLLRWRGNIGKWLDRFWIYCWLSSECLIHLIELEDEVILNLILCCKQFKIYYIFLLKLYLKVINIHFFSIEVPIVRTQLKIFDFFESIRFRLLKILFFLIFIFSSYRTHFKD